MTTVRPEVRGYFDHRTNTVTYLVWDRETRAAAVVDPVLGYDIVDGLVDTRAADELFLVAAAEGLTIELVLETHVHADHLTAASYLRDKTGAKIAIGNRVGTVQDVFGPMFGADDLRPDDFDLLVGDGQRLQLGSLGVEVIATPGHTAADVSYRIGDAIFVGDTLFMPDYGTARTDFPGGDARQLYRSIQRILALPPETRLFLCHDYKAPGRDEFCWETTVERQRGNVHLAGASEDSFVAMRESRDAALSTPKLLLPSIQVNIRAGRLPPPDSEGRSYLRIPIRFAAGAAPN